MGSPKSNRMLPWSPSPPSYDACFPGNGRDTIAVLRGRGEMGVVACHRVRTDLTLPSHSKSVRVQRQDGHTVKITGSGNTDLLQFFPNDYHMNDDEGRMSILKEKQIRSFLVVRAMDMNMSDEDV